MAQMPKSRLVKGPYKPICRDCAIYFSTTVATSFIFKYSIGSIVYVKLFSQNQVLSGYPTKQT